MIEFRIIAKPVEIGQIVGILEASGMVVTNQSKEYPARGTENKVRVYVSCCFREDVEKEGI